MTRDQVQSTILRLLGTFAPEADLNRLPPEVSFRDYLDLDSMDFLNFVTALYKELRVNVPEQDYLKISTLNGCVDYVRECLDRVGAKA